MDLISNGYTFEMISSIMKELLISRQFQFLMGFLKHPAYDFRLIYDESCKSLTIDIFKEITFSLNSDDQKILLSERCICHANKFLNLISTEDVKLFPVSPLIYEKINPLLVRSEIFAAILEQALRTYSDPKSKPIPFHQWMNKDTNNLFPELYFRHEFYVTKLIISTLSGLSFYELSFKFQEWLLHAFKIHIDTLLYSANLPKEELFWNDLLKMFITLLSILKHKPKEIVCKDIEFEYEYEYKCDRDEFNNYVRNNNETIQYLILKISGFCRALNNNIIIIPEYGKQIIEIVNCLKNSNEGGCVSLRLINVFNVALAITTGLHPDWLVGLISLNLPTNQDELSIVLKYFFNRNPHEIAIVTLLTIIEEEYVSITCSRLFLDFVKPETSFLKKKFITLRSKCVYFPVRLQRVKITGLLNVPKEPQILFRDIVQVLLEHYDYDISPSLNSIQVTSNAKYFELKFVNIHDFIQKALETFLKLPEFYTVTGISTPTPTTTAKLSIIPSPILPYEYISIIFELLIYYGLSGKSAPFKIDHQYFSFISNSDSAVDLHMIFANQIEHIKEPFFKISKALGHETLFNNSDYMSVIVRKYSEISELELEPFELSKIEYDWLKNSFFNTASKIRIPISSIFNGYDCDDIYNIFFNK